MPYQYPVLAGLMVQRLWELVVSRRNLEGAEREEGEGEGEGENGEAPTLIPEPQYPAMVAVHVAWFAGCWAEVILLRPAYVAWLVIPMLAVWALSLGLRIWMLAALGPLWSVRLISRPEQPVVASGPYRYIRHPNYLAVILEITAVPLLLGAYWTALWATVANGAVLWLRIRDEEAYLFTVDAYRDAFADKKRLIPGVF